MEEEENGEWTRKKAQLFAIFSEVHVEDQGMKNYNCDRKKTTHGCKPAPYMEKIPK